MTAAACRILTVCIHICVSVFVVMDIWQCRAWCWMIQLLYTTIQTQRNSTTTTGSYTFTVYSMSELQTSFYSLLIHRLSDSRLEYSDFVTDNSSLTFRLACMSSSSVLWLLVFVIYLIYRILMCFFVACAERSVVGSALVFKALHSLS